MNNYKIVIEVPTYLNTKQGRELSVRTFTQFVYNRKNKESALRKFGSVENLRHLRKNGINITRAEYRQNRNKIFIERI